MLAHASLLLSCISNVIKRFIQLTQVIIGVHSFAKIYLCRDLIQEFLSWRISYYDMKCSTDNVMGEHH